MSTSVTQTVNAAAEALVSVSFRLDKSAIAAAQASAREQLRAEAKARRVDLKLKIKTERTALTKASKALIARAKAEKAQITTALKEAIKKSDVDVPQQFRARNTTCAENGVLALQIGARDRLAKGIV